MNYLESLKMILRPRTHFDGVEDKMKYYMGKGKYDTLTPKESNEIREIYRQILLKSHPNIDLNSSNTQVLLLNGIPLLNGYDRVVIGDAGAYIEFTDKHLLLTLETKQGEEYREKFENIKYLWKHPINHPDVKIYYQLKTVKYADYKPSKYYVSVEEVVI